MDNCIFCSIINRQIPADILFEDEKMIIIRDIAPKAKKHYLLIVKEHFQYLSQMTPENADSLGQCLKKAGELSKDLGLLDGFRVIINQGENAGQTVFHLHCHLLGGQKLND